MKGKIEKKDKKKEGGREKWIKSDKEKQTGRERWREKGKNVEEILNNKIGSGRER